MPFFSRRIGLDDRGTQQPIDVGAKLTGQQGAFDVGFLQVRTADTELQPGEDMSVVRLRRRAFEQSYVGALYTRRSARLAGDTDRHTAGLDFELATSKFRGNQNVELSGFYLWTSSLENADDTSGYGFRLAYPNDPFSAEIAVRELQPNYDPAIGFVERRGYKRIAPTAEYSWRPRSNPWLRSLGWEVELDFINDSENRSLTRELSFTPLEINFEDGSRVAFDVTPTYERLEEDFEIYDDIVLPEGAVYEFTEYQIQASSADHRMIAVGGNMSTGGFFSGHRTEYSAEIGFRPQTWHRVDARGGAQRSRPGGGEFRHRRLPHEGRHTVQPVDLRWRTTSSSTPSAGCSAGRCASGGFDGRATICMSSTRTTGTNCQMSAGDG